MTDATMAENGNGYRSLWIDLLAKNGPWCAIAVALGFWVWTTSIEPAAAERNAVRADRQKLLDAVTLSLERNSQSMSKMSSAVESLNKALNDLHASHTRAEALQKETTEALQEFAGAVSGTHAEQLKRLEEIKNKLDSS
jgi:hypothetical protein